MIEFNDDFDQQTLTVMFEIGATNNNERDSTQMVSIIADSALEGEHSFTVTLSASDALAGGYTLGSRNVLTVVISDNPTDLAGFTFIFSPSTSPVEGVPDFSVDVCSFVTLSGITLECDVTVTVTVIDTVEADEGVDFISPTGPGSLEYLFDTSTTNGPGPCLTFGIADDDNFEGDHSFTVSVSSTTPSGITIPQPEPATIVTITDDDDPLVGFVQPSYTVQEGRDETVSVCIRLLGPEGGLSRQFTVTLSATAGTAESGVDYTASDYSVTRTFQTQVTVGSGSEQCIQLTIVDDTIAESSESFAVSLTSSEPRVRINGGSVASVIILDNDNNTHGIPTRPNVAGIILTTGSQITLLSPVNLTCLATGFPPPTYHWYRDGREIEGEAESYLYIGQFSLEDRGYYHCEATNSNGSDISNQILLKLQGIRQYLVEIITTQDSSNTKTDEEVATQINSTLLGQNISAQVYQVITQSSYSTVQSFLVTLNVNQTRASNRLLTQAIKMALLQDEFTSDNNASVNVVRFDGCPGLTNDPINAQFPNITFTWPETEIGDEIPYICPCQNLTSTEKSATRVCGGNYSDGALWDRVNVTEDCGLSTITLQLCQAQIVSASNPEVLSKVLVNVTSATEEIQAVDISVATTLIEELTEEATSAENEEVRENFLRTIDNIIRADSEEVAQSQDDTQASTRLLTTITSFSDNVEVSNTTNSTTFIQTSYAIRIANIDTTEFTGETLTFDLGSVDDAISGESVIDSNAISTVAGTERNVQPAVTAAVRVPKSIFEELGVNKSEVQRLSYALFTQGSLFQSSDVNQSNLTLGSVVVSIRVSGTRDTQTLTTPIEVLFQPSQLIENATDTLCGQWDPTYNDGRGAWSTDSCVLVEEDTNTVGLANDESQTNNQRSRRDDQTPVTDEVSSDDGENVMVHYSQPGHFGLLLDLTYRVVEPPPEVFSFVLQVISYIGLTISLFCLAIFLVTYLTTKQLRTSEHCQILINMSIALMGLYIMFLIGAHASPVPVLCSISAVLLQYFMLVFFAWTAVEAFFLYMKLVKVLGTHIPKFVLKGGLIAWLLPWIVVVVSVGPGYRSYYNDEMSHGFCRAIGLPFWLGTILPFVITYVFNWIMFVIIVVSLYRHAKRKFEIKDKQMDKIQFVKRQVLIAFGLATLFGLGWGFGLAASGTTVHGLTLAFQIIFSIFVGSQGILFFLLHGVKQEEARNQWKRCFTTITRHLIHR